MLYLVLYIFGLSTLNQRQYFFFNKDSFKGWYEYLKVGVPSTFLLCAEWWGFEVLAMIAVWIGKLDYTTHIMIFNFAGNIYSMNIGFGTSGTVLVGNAIGEGNLQKVSRYCKINYYFGFIIIVIISTFQFFFRNSILLIYDAEEDVIQKGSKVLALMSLMNLFDYTQTIFVCYFRGIGKQFIAMFISFGNFYVVQVGLAILFGKVLQMGVFGIWLAVTICVCLSSTLYFVIYMMFDYEKIKQEIFERIEHDKKKLENKENNVEVI